VGERGEFGPFFMFKNIPGFANKNAPGAALLFAHPNGGGGLSGESKCLGSTGGGWWTPIGGGGCNNAHNFIGRGWVWELIFLMVDWGCFRGGGKRGGHFWFSDFTISFRLLFFSGQGGGWDTLWGLCFKDLFIKGGTYKGGWGNHR